MRYPRSMTGFGRGEAAAEAIGWVVEVKSVNHRYCDIKVKIPKGFSGLEEKVRRKAQAYHSRGHVEVTITPAAESVATQVLRADLALAREYKRCLEEIRDELGLDEQVTLSMIKDYREIIVATEPDLDLETVWPPLEQALDQAFSECLAMRVQEGAATAGELADRLQGFAATVESIEEQLPRINQERAAKLNERIQTLLAGVDADPARIHQEIAILADKSDVTEEIVRLKSHISQFRNLLAAQEPTGRRLDFLLQEFFREINTLASKISESQVGHLAVELKNEVEKLREQVQNLE